MLDPLEAARTRTTQANCRAAPKFKIPPASVTRPRAADGAYSDCVQPLKAAQPPENGSAHSQENGIDKLAVSDGSSLTVKRDSANSNLPQRKTDDQSAFSHFGTKFASGKARLQECRTSAPAMWLIPAQLRIRILNKLTEALIQLANQMTEVPISLLIVEDDADFRDSSLRWMQRKGHVVAAAASGAEALSLCDRQHFDVGIFDMNMPGMSGMELLQRVRDQNIDMEVIILTGQGTINSAVQAMKMGATDYLTKPFPLGDLEHHCQLARERGRLRRENEHLKVAISRSRPASELVGSSEAMTRVSKLIARIAPTDKPVLITGESGTGKEVVAKAIQQASQLASQPFVTVNCAALPEQLVESELFGHQKGSFTGASSDKPGLFEVADGGTLFIDELGEMPLSVQPKLLRALEDGSMRRIGSHKERKVKVRIIAATNRDLGEDVKEGKFREDLYYRVNVLPIELPPLRERLGDIELLVRHFLPEPWTVDPEAMEALKQYRWPGNVRELINVIQRATILADGDEITMDDLPREVADFSGSDTPALSRGLGDSPKASPSATSTPSAVPDRLDDIAKAHVVEVLAKHNGNKAQAARALGIHRRKLYRLLEKYEIATASPESKMHAPKNSTESAEDHENAAASSVSAPAQGTSGSV